MKAVFCAVFLVLFFVSSCCSTLPPTKVVTVYKSCVLPDKIKLELPELTKEGCPSGLVCFDTDSFGRLVGTIDRLILWVRQARVRCENNESSSQPSE